LDDGQLAAPADVFLVYPTGYFGFKHNAPAKSTWLDPLGKFNDIIADAVVGIHGSAFNGVGRVYAPRYRQMTGWGYMAYDNRTRHLQAEALAIALSDVERAFDHFLQVRGPASRPIVIVGHSQGSMLLAELLRTRFSADAGLYKALVAAYLTGTLLFEDGLGAVPVCKTPTDVHCFVGYNAFELGGDHLEFVLRRRPHVSDTRVMACVNPLSWRADEVHVPRDRNPGSRPVLRLTRLVSALADVVLRGRAFNPSSPLEVGLHGGQCKHGVLWTEAVETSGFWTTGVFPGRNLHGEESSLFYLSTRQNIESRLREWQRKAEASWF